MAGACCLAVECDETRADFRLRTRYVDEKTDNLDDALAMIDRWTAAGMAKSVALIGNAADVFPELFKRGVRPDMSQIKPPHMIQSTGIYHRAGLSQNGAPSRKVILR